MSTSFQKFLYDEFDPSARADGLSPERGGSRQRFGKSAEQLAESVGWSHQNHAAFEELQNADRAARLTQERDEFLELFSSSSEQQEKRGQQKSYDMTDTAVGIFSNLIECFVWIVGALSVLLLLLMLPVLPILILCGGGSVLAGLLAIASRSGRRRGRGIFRTQSKAQFPNR